MIGCLLIIELLGWGLLLSAILIGIIIFALRMGWISE